MTAETIIEEAEPAGPGAREILFRSERLEVRRVAAGNGQRQVVTFESYHDDAGFDRSGFGEGFFERSGLTGVHVVSAGNDWYQYPEVDEALAVIREAVAGADRVLTYGSSMGGYAALRFADAVGATHALALSPQYSIDPRRVAADRRWSWDQKRIRFAPRHNGALACRADAVVAFDPTLKLDRLHAELIGEDVDCRFLRLAYAGHPVSTVLAELGLLQTLPLDLLNGTLDLAAIEADYTARRQEASMWLAEYAARLPGGDKIAARDLTARAATIAPANPAIQHQYGMRLHDLGMYEDAILAHRAAVATTPHPIFMLSLSRSLFFAGRYDEALEWGERALAERSYDDFYHHSIARVRLALGDRAGAWRAACTAFRLAKRPRTILDLVYYATHRVFG